MGQLIEFAGNHLALVGTLLLVGFLLAQNLIADIGGSKDSVDPLGATELINREEAVVVDVRPMADFSAGHILHAINIPMNSFANQSGMLEKYKGRPLIISCRSGNQSSMACKQLRSKGFERVYNLRGGIMAWQGANLPVSRKG